MEIEKRINNILKSISNKNFLIACSGGPDSVFLAIMTHYLYPENNHHLVYFNHQLRPNEITNEINLIQELGQKLTMKVHIKDLEFKEKNQAIFREKRQEGLIKLATELNLKDIILGHHLDDDIETFVMQFLKGSTTNLRGIPHKTNIHNIEFHHPLLSITKDEIMTYLNSNKISFCIDSSNKSTTYKRNQIRRTIECVQKKHAMNKVKLKNSFNYLKLIENEKKKEAQELFKKSIKINNHHFFKKSDLNNSDKTMYIIKVLIEQNFNSYVNHDHLKKITNGLQSNNKKIIKLDNCIIQIDYKWVQIFQEVQKHESFKLNLGINQFTFGTCVSTTLTTSLNSNHDRLCINIKDLKKIEITSIQQSSLVTGKFKKKLRESNISPIEQEFYPVIQTYNEVLWIPNVYFKESKGKTIITFNSNVK
ncbi:MAG: tRNA lysidine(34) synthetase TilS [Candidatus Margulisiibacteriota bacterium]